MSYHRTVFEEIYRRIALGDNLSVIVTRPGMPALNTIYQWMKEAPGFAEGYDHARAMRADARSDRIDEYVRRMLDPEKPLRHEIAAVAIKAEQWQATREAPKKYGDKQDVNVSGGLTFAQLVEESVKPRIAVDNIKQIK